MPDQSARQYGADRIEAVFCDTDWEHPDTYQHITNVCQQMNIKLTTLKPELGFVELAKEKETFPLGYRAILHYRTKDKTYD